MKYLVILFAFMLTSCAQLGINIGNETNSNIYNGPVHIHNTTRIDTVIQVIDRYPSSRRSYINPVELENYKTQSSFSDYGRHLGADWTVSAYFGQLSDTSTHNETLSFGFGVGGEGYLYSSEAHFRAGIAPSVRWLTINESEYRSLSFIQLEIGFKLSFGNMRNRGYLMAIISAILYASDDVPDKQYLSSSDEIEFNGHTMGFEIGYTHLFSNKSSFDIFLRSDSSPFKYKYKDEPLVCSFGLRMNV